MIPSRETLQRLQRQWAFGTGPLEIVVRLGDLLQAITEDKFLSPCLVLKGGTVLNLCMGHPARLSVDLDFNYVGSADKAEMVKQRPAVLGTVEKNARRAGYRIQRSREEHAGQKLYLGFRSAFGNEAQLQVDIGFLHRVPLLAPVELGVWSPLTEERLVIRTVSTAELVAGKTLAALDRAAPRDLYDVAKLPERLPGVEREPTVRRIFVALSGTLNRALLEYGQKRFDRVTDEAVAAKLHPLLRENDRPPAAELKAQAWNVIAPWLELSEAEREYSLRIQHGEFRPELVFPDDPPLADRLRQHPALLWKAENARRHHGRERHRRAGSEE